MYARVNDLPFVLALCRCLGAGYAGRLVKSCVCGGLRYFSVCYRCGSVD